MNNRELHILHIDAHLDELRIEERYIRHPETLPDYDFNVHPLIRTIGSDKLSATSYSRIARRVNTGGFDAISLMIPGYPNLYQPFPNRNPLKNLRGLSGFARLATRYLLLLNLVRDSSVPFLMFDRLDASVIDKRWFPFMKYCRAYFKRELPKCHVHAFLYSENIASEPWRNLQRYAAFLPKLRPFSNGLPDDIVELPLPDLKRDIDVLWGGAVQISPVRERGLEQLRKLKRKGYRVEICERKVSKAEYYELIRRSYLVWSPEGTGWYCWKHYEAGAMESVPVISYPTVWQDKPLIDEEHCFYYDPEEDGLIKTVEKALTDKERLVRMGRDSRPFILRNHTELSSYLRSTFEALEPVAPGGVLAEGGLV